MILLQSHQSSALYVTAITYNSFIYFFNVKNCEGFDVLPYFQGTLQPSLHPELLWMLAENTKPLRQIKYKELYRSW